MNTFLLPLVILWISGCAMSPEALVKERYKNLKEDRKIEVVYRSNNAAVIVGYRLDGKCKETETVALSSVNIEHMWKIVRSVNLRECDSNETKSFNDRFKKWQESKL